MGKPTLELNFGSGSQVVAIMMEVLNQQLGMNMVRVDYSGGGPMLQAVLSGTVHATVLAESAVSQGGDRMQVIAVTGEGRSAGLPNVPTFTELGFPQLGGVRFSLSVRSYAQAGNPETTRSDLTCTE